MLFDIAGPQAQSRVTQDSWLTPQAYGHRPESPWKAGRPRGPSDRSAIIPGEVVKIVGPWTRARVAWESWSTPLALGP